MSVFFTNLVLTLLLQSPPSEGFNAKKQIHTNPVRTSNSHFCRCDTEGESFSLIRVDISEGQKHETKVRSYPKGSFTLPQCEDGIVNHPSCL